MESSPINSTNLAYSPLLNCRLNRIIIKNWQQKLQDYLNYRFKRFHPKRQRTGRK